MAEGEENASQIAGQQPEVYRKPLENTQDGNENKWEFVNRTWELRDEEGSVNLEWCELSKDMEIEDLSEYKVQKFQDHTSRKMEAVRGCFRKSAAKLGKGL